MTFSSRKLQVLHRSKHADRDDDELQSKKSAPAAGNGGGWDELRSTKSAPERVRDILERGLAENPGPRRAALPARADDQDGRPDPNPNPAPTTPSKLRQMMTLGGGAPKSPKREKSPARGPTDAELATFEERSLLAFHVQRAWGDTTRRSSPTAPSPSPTSRC